MFLGKAVVMGLSMFIGYLIIMYSEDTKDEVHSPIAPCIVIGIISYIIGSVFLSVYSFSSTAILHCFLLNEDLKINEAPKCLQVFLDENDNYNAKQKKGSGKKKGKDDEKKKDEDKEGPRANDVA